MLSEELDFENDVLSPCKSLNRKRWDWLSSCAREEIREFEALERLLVVGPATLDINEQQNVSQKVGNSPEKDLVSFQKDDAHNEHVDALQIHEDELSSTHHLLEDSTFVCFLLEIYVA